MSKIPSPPARETSVMIPEAWIKGYVDQLLELASKLPEGPMRSATLLRAEHAMDLVLAWRVRASAS